MDQRTDRVLAVLLLGTISAPSPLRLLRGQTQTILRLIYTFVQEMHRASVSMEGVYAKSIGTVKFPHGKGLKINMMPFTMGDPDSLPQEYRHYWNLISSLPVNEDEMGKIGYLTIDEGYVEAGASQRRPGLHIEDSSGTDDVFPGRINIKRGGWGIGSYVRHRFIGGLFMASTVANSCRVWNVGVKKNAHVVARLGDIEHLRPILPEGTLMQASQMWWLTDATPHESLPLPVRTYRQYFRVVTSEVAMWYAKHSTANPLGVIPPCPIITHDKFNPPTSDTTSTSTTTSTTTITASTTTTSTTASTTSSITSSTASSTTITASPTTTATTITASPTTTATTITASPTTTSSTTTTASPTSSIGDLSAAVASTTTTTTTKSNGKGRGKRKGKGKGKRQGKGGK